MTLAAAPGALEFNASRAVKEKGAGPQLFLQQSPPILAQQLSFLSLQQAWAWSVLGLQQAVSLQQAPLAQQSMACPS